MKSGSKLYILCGGQSRRMGRDKAMVELQGERLLDCQIRMGENYFDEVVLLCGQNSYPVENRQLPDQIENAGPLSGLLEALKGGAANSLKQIAIIPVDLPGISEDTIQQLALSKLNESDQALLLKSGEDLQPLAGIYSVDLASKLEHFLKTGNRMVFAFVNGLEYSVIEVGQEELRNLNRPEDLR